MSISEISPTSALPDRKSERMSVSAARAFGPGSVRSAASSASLRPLITGTFGATACGSSPSNRPSSSSQCSVRFDTSGKGRRSSTRIVTRLGSSRMTSARRISGTVCRRAVTVAGSMRKMLAGAGIPAASTTRSADARDTPRTSTPAMANRAAVRGQPTPPATPLPPATTMTAIASHRRVADRRARVRAAPADREAARPTFWRAMSAERSPTSPGHDGCPRGDSSPLLTDDPDLVLQHDPVVRLDALPGELHQGLDVGGRGPTAIDDEVGVLGRDLGAVEALALEADLLDHSRRGLARRVLPDASGRGQRQRLARLLLLEPLLDVFLDLAQRPAVQTQPAADQHGTRREVERAIREGARVGLELAQRAVGIEEVGCTDEVADATVGRAGVHRQRAADRRRNPDQTLEAAQVERGPLADERGEAGPGPGHGLLAVELGAPEAAFELEHDAAHAAVAHEQVVAAADDDDRELLPLGEGERVTGDGPDSRTVHDVGRDTGTGLLTRCVDVQDDEDVGLVEGGEELLAQVMSARIPMRLKYGDEPTLEASLGGGQRRADLGGMVTVIVDDGHAARLAAYLEASLHAGETGQRLLDRVERNLEIEPDADGGEGIEDVVAAGNLQRTLTEPRPAMDDVEAAGQPRQVDAPGHQIRARRQAVRDEALLEARDQHLDVRLVEAQHRRAVERHLVDEGQEAFPDRVERAPVVEVLGVDRRDHGDGRREGEERAVRLVGLGDEEVALTEPGVASEARPAAADDDRRIVAALGEDCPDHRRRRRLSVRAGNGNAVLESHQLGQHLCAPNGRDGAMASGLDLHVVGGHGGRIDDDVGALHVAGLVPREHLDAQPLEALDRLVALQIRAGHAVAQVGPDLGDARHPDAADADEVDLLVALKHGRAGRC